VRRCDHVRPHDVAPPRDEGEFCFRHYLRAQGWLRAGYCEVYYPTWLLRGHFRAWATGLVGLHEVAPAWLSEALG